VVDDSLPVRKQVEIEFSLMGVKADLVESGDLALMRIQERPYDIIFLDVVMPGVDGYEVCKRIRRMSAYKAVPIVLLTSRSSSFDKLKGALAGCDTYLVKPINHNEFDKVLAKHFALIASNGVN
jgi:two-component system cell cycle response regulator